MQCLRDIPLSQDTQYIYKGKKFLSLILTETVIARQILDSYLHQILFPTSLLLLVFENNEYDHNLLTLLDDEVFTRELQDELSRI